MIVRQTARPAKPTATAADTAHRRATQVNCHYFRKGAKYCDERDSTYVSLQWKSYENRLRFHRIMAMSLACSFLGPPCIHKLAYLNGHVRALQIMLRYVAVFYSDEFTVCWGLFSGFFHDVRFHITMITEPMEPTKIGRNTFGYKFRAYTQGGST